MMCPKVEKAAEAKVKPVVESSLSNVNYNQVYLQTIMVKLRAAREKKTSTTGPWIPAFVHEERRGLVHAV